VIKEVQKWYKVLYWCILVFPSCSTKGWVHPAEKCLEFIVDKIKRRKKMGKRNDTKNSRDSDDNDNGLSHKSTHQNQIFYYPVQDFIHCTYIIVQSTKRERKRSGDCIFTFVCVSSLLPSTRRRSLKKRLIYCCINVCGRITSWIKSCILSLLCHI
jgi:hypothetical protein